MLCEWCRGAEATAEVELEPAKYRKDKRTGVRVIAKPAKKLRVCKAHRQLVEKQLDDARRAKAAG